MKVTRQIDMNQPTPESTTAYDIKGLARASCSEHPNQRIKPLVYRS
jgi:hypothetical protein